ncbi:hypothetical protein L6R52_19420 [Myxococcota bacterium]|nr:hypothetical protein [Myxococcota bacterium]
MWSNFFENGGFGMYPTALFGFALIAFAVLHVVRPEPRWARIVANATALTAMSGVLGTAVGLVTTFRYVESLAPEKQLTIALIGAAESLNNLVLAMILCVLGTLLALVAALRSARSGSV